MDKIKLIQNIGNEVCEECGSDADCGINPNNCSRIDDAIALFDQYISNLIAAAPDLLKACETILMWSNSKSNSCDKIETIYQIAKQAISKAKGK